MNMVIQQKNRESYTYSWASLVVQTVKTMPLLQCRRPGRDTWVGKIPQRRKQHPTPVFLPREFHGHRSLEGCCPWVSKRQTELSNYHFHHLSIIHIHRKRKEMIQMNSQNRKIFTDLGNLWFPGGKNGVKGLSGSLGWMYTWLYLKCIINKDLLYSTWNSAQ